MTLFTTQPVHCNACGKQFSTDFRSYGGRVCSRECHAELEWRKTLSIMGQPYYPQSGAPINDWKLDADGAWVTERENARCVVSLDHSLSLYHCIVTKGSEVVHSFLTIDAEKGKTILSSLWKSV
jgi:hypothetical protein